VNLPLAAAAAAAAAGVFFVGFAMCVGDPPH